MTALLVGAGRISGYKRYSLAGWRPAAQDDLVAPPEMVLSDLREAWSSALAGRQAGGTSILSWIHGSTSEIYV
jgi:hypothetical protein